LGFYRGNTLKYPGTYPRLILNKSHWLANHVLAYYPAVFGHGNRVIDLSDNRRDGTWVDNDTRIAYGNGIGAAFNGVGSTGHYFDVGNWNTDTVSITISCWVYLNTTSGDQRIIAKATGTASNDHFWMLGTNGTNWRIRMKEQSFGTATLVGGTASTGQWYHFIGMYDTNQANEMRICIDGSNIATASHGSSLVNDSTATIRMLGTVGGANSNYLDGYMAHPQVFNIGLSDAQCETLYKEGPDALLIPEPRIFGFSSDVFKSVSDIGGGVGSIAALTVDATVSETGAGADAPGAIANTIPPLAEAGAGTDAQAIGVGLTIAETGAGADTPGAIAAGLTIAEAGAGADAPGAIANTIPPLAEAGAGTDAQAIGVGLTIAETGAGADTPGAIAAGLTIAEAGAGADSILSQVLATIAETAVASDSINQITVSLTPQETGTGTDQLAGLTVQFTVTEAGAGNDSINQITVSLTLSETASGTEAVDVIGDILKSVSDTGTGSATIAATVSLTVSDSATGTDVQLINNLLQLVESAIGTDQISSIGASISVADAAAASELIGQITAAFAVSDAITGADLITIYGDEKQIVTMTFVLKKRITTFVLKIRSATFSLKKRTATFTLTHGGMRI